MRGSKRRITSAWTQFVLGELMRGGVAVQGQIESGQQQRHIPIRFVLRTSSSSRPSVVHAAHPAVAARPTSRNTRGIKPPASALSRCRNVMLCQQRLEYLVARPHPWRCQLYVKGRKLRALDGLMDMQTTR